MNDRDLQNLLRRAMPDAEPPSFADTWRAAVARHRRGPRRSAALAGSVATLALVAIVVNALMPAEEEPDFIEMAELLGTTSWQAPSDVLLPAREFDIYQELPELIESTGEAGGALL